MQLFCPTCDNAFPGVSRCPRCGGLLLMPHEVAVEAPTRQPDPPAPLRPTMLGRLAVGTILALGLYLAARKIAIGLVLATEPDPAGWWMSFKGLAAVHASQILAVIFGAVVAAAGRTRGYPLGLGVGVVCGGLFLGYELLAGAPPQDLVLYLQTPVLAVFGLVAGVLGSRIWGAAPYLDIRPPVSGKLSSLRLLEESAGNPSPPTLWVRVLIGALVIVVGVTLADQSRHTAQKYSGGLLRVQSIGQGEYLTWQLATFAVLLGGAAAGAATGAGIRHGLLAGVIGGATLLAVYYKTGGSIPPVDWWLTRLSLDDHPLTSPSVITAIVGSVFLVGMVGGWLGGQLFLPLAPEHMRRRIRIGDD